MPNSKSAIFVAALITVAAMAQGPVIATLDLSSPALGQNADLPLNELPGPALVESLQPLVDKQIAQGKVEPTVYESLGDEDTGIAPYQNFTPLLRDLACHSDAIVTGRADASLSHLSASGSTIYSDYDFQINDMLKSGSGVPLQPQLHIVVTRPGGKVPATGGFVRYANQMFLLLRPDTTYLLFLSQIPATGAFQPASLGTNGQVFSTLEMQPSGSQWRIYRTAYIQRDFPEFADATLRSIIATALVGCK